MAQQKTLTKDQLRSLANITDKDVNRAIARTRDKIIIKLVKAKT